MAMLAKVALLVSPLPSPDFEIVCNRDEDSRNIRGPTSVSRYESVGSNAILDNELWAVERLQTLARRRVPDLDGAIVRSRRELPRVVREHDRRDPIAMALERLQTLARRRVPDLDGAIVRSRRELPRVVREHDRPDPIAMAVERLQTLARRRVPDLDGAIVRSRRELPRVVREHDRPDPIAMARRASADTRPSPRPRS